MRAQIEESRVVPRAVEQKTSPLSSWLPVILWTGVIVLESGFGSSTNTAPFLRRFVQWIFGPMDQPHFNLIHHIVRKCGHFFGYGILGYLWLRALTNTVARWSRAKCAALALLCTFVVASLDEWHQTFSSARTASFIDVLLDSSGALVLIIVAMLVFARRRELRA